MLFELQTKFLIEKEFKGNNYLLLKLENIYFNNQNKSLEIDCFKKSIQRFKDELEILKMKIKYDENVIFLYKIE